jgi:hypothetical protein
MYRPTLWSTPTFQTCSLRHITGDEDSWATKGITNATMVQNTIIVSKVIVATIWSEVIVVTI